MDIKFSNFIERLSRDKVHMITGFDHMNLEFDVTFMKNEGPTRTYSTPMDKLIYLTNDYDKTFWLENLYERFLVYCELYGKGVRG